MFSAVVTGACLLGFPPNNLWKVQSGAQVTAPEKKMELVGPLCRPEMTG